jgi:hypothetical protein
LPFLERFRIRLVNNPFKVMIAQDDWTCTIAEFTGTMKGSMTMGDRKVIVATKQGLQGGFLYRGSLE